jgi:hypothetical protein
MLAMFWVLLYLVMLAGAAMRYGADSRRTVDTRQLDWSVRTS